MVNAISKRRSVRQFLEREIEKEKIEFLLRAAMQAPSARNQQPWHFIVVTVRESILKIKDIALNWHSLETATLAIVLLTDKRDLKAPQMYVQDMASATENILLECVNQSLGAVWLGTYPSKERMDGLSSLLKIPADFEPFSVIAIGYPANSDANTFIDRYNPARVHNEEF